MIPFTTWAADSSDFGFMNVYSCSETVCSVGLKSRGDGAITNCHLLKNNQVLRLKRERGKQ